jgi:hypothetical protein
LGAKDEEEGTETKVAEIENTDEIKTFAQETISVETSDNDGEKGALTDDEKLLVNNNNHIAISHFKKELFKWWPNILVFLFGQANIGRLVNEEMVPTKHIYCLHQFPDLSETVHPITRQVLNMLQTFGARKSDSHKENKQCCLLFCKNAGTHLPLGPKSQLVKSGKDVHVFAIALQGSHFSKDLAACADKCFSKHNLMNLILVLLTELSLINVQMKHNGKEHKKSGVHIPSLLYYFIAHLVFIFNIPALLIHLATSMVYLWSILIILSPLNADDKVKYMNIGIVISSVAAMLTVILTEILLYPDFFLCPISVPISVYLLIWQIGVGITLQEKYNYKYGIFSIPSRLLKKA